MRSKKPKEIASLDLGDQFDNWQKEAKKMERRELEEAIFLELKAIQSELRLILKDKSPKNS